MVHLKALNQPIKIAEKENPSFAYSLASVQKHTKTIL